MENPSTTQKYALEIAICWTIVKFFYQQIAKTLLFQMRYDSLLNSEK